MEVRRPPINTVHVRCRRARENDIAGDWKENLEKQGYRVDVLMEGLGQNPAIQDIIVQHARFCATHKYLDIVKKKKEYAQGKEKYE